MKRKTILSGTVAMSILAMSIFTSCGNSEETKENNESTMESHDGSDEGKCGDGKCGEGKCGGSNENTETKCGDGNENTEAKCGEGKCGE